MKKKESILLQSEIRSLASPERTCHAIRSSLSIPNVRLSFIVNYVKRNKLPFKLGERKHIAKTPRVNFFTSDRPITRSKRESMLAQQYLEDWLKGDYSAFGKLYQISFKFLKRTGEISFKLQPDKAEEMASVTMERVHKYISTYDINKSRYYTWVHRIHRNVFLKEVQLKDFIPQPYDTYEFLEVADTEDMSFQATDSEKQLIKEALNYLKPHQKQIVELFLDGYNHQDITKLTGKGNPTQIFTKALKDIKKLSLGRKKDI